ncbi:ABC transporter ATP-binding protein [Halegenticoccus tardaugens]|uniref:ABC transporter ATP-binding protein n=1 Tax=Halegenticoccus tardaugens TaxID=2071624 RepID=UPI001E3866BB|nr:ABC transporter ATP-binding protein [Halegenticoccus tardaugens]
MTEVRLDGVRKEYGETAALSRVDLRIRDGEFFTLVGPSGCGKTTTLRLIAGFETPTAGRVLFDGADATGVPPESRGVGVVFQNYALFPHMTVAENVGYGLRFSDPPDGSDRRERVAGLLSLVNLDGLGDRRPEALSGGQQQRVALARALAPGPRLLLLDEPMSALDARLRERLRLQVKEIQSALGVTTVYVTHDQEEALAVSDRVAVMNDGGIEQVGAPRAVYRRPGSRFVAAFVGHNNVLDGEIVADRDRFDSGDEMEGFDLGRETGELDADRMRVAVGDETFAIPSPDVAERGAASGTPESPSVGDRITFCVRPEHLRLGAGENRLRATVESAEFLGDSTRVHLDWKGRRLTLRADDAGMYVEEGTGMHGENDVSTGEVEVGFDPDDAHVVEVR